MASNISFSSLIFQFIPAGRVASGSGLRATAVHANRMRRPQATIANVRRIQSLVRCAQISVGTAGIAEVRNAEWGLSCIYRDRQIS